jgi:hypothetical protein
MKEYKEKMKFILMKNKITGTTKMFKNTNIKPVLVTLHALQSKPTVKQKDGKYNQSGRLLSILCGTVVTAACRLLRVSVEGTVPRYGGQLRV